jgi:protein CrcB
VAWAALPGIFAKGGRFGYFLILSHLVRLPSMSPAVFLIGLFWGMTFRTFQTNENWKLFLMTGICGGFTTFSAFTLEGIALLKEQRPGLFLLYLGGSVVVGLVATYAGMKIVRG